MEEKIKVSVSTLFPSEECVESIKEGVVVHLNNLILAKSFNIEMVGPNADDADLIIFAGRNQTGLRCTEKPALIIGNKEMTYKSVNSFLRKNVKKLS